MKLVFRSLENWVVCLLMSSKSSFYILDWVFSQIHVLQTSPWSVYCPFIFVVGSVPHPTSFFFVTSSHPDGCVSCLLPLLQHQLCEFRGWFSGCVFSSRHSGYSVHICSVAMLVPLAISQLPGAGGQGLVRGDPRAGSCTLPGQHRGGLSWGMSLSGYEAGKGQRDFSRVRLRNSPPPFSCQQSHPTGHTHPPSAWHWPRSPTCWPAHRQEQDEFLQEMDGGGVSKRHN